MIAYDSSVDPAAPFLEITVANISQKRRRETLSALLDTGSDVTAIPGGLVDSLRLEPIGRLQLEDVKTETILVYTYAVRLTAAGLTIPRLEVILTGFDFIVLGRVSSPYVRVGAGLAPDPPGRPQGCVPTF